MTHCKMQKLQKDPLSDSISTKNVNLLLTHTAPSSLLPCSRGRCATKNRFCVQIVIDYTAVDHRLYHSCGFPPRRCLFSKHITSVNSGGGARRWGEGYSVQNFSPLFCSYPLSVQWGNGGGCNVDAVCNVSTVRHPGTSCSMG